MKWDELDTTYLRSLVIAGGGVWVGVQEAVDPDNTLVLFNSPFHKSTLAVPLKSITVDAVQNKIQASNKTFVPPLASHPDFAPFIRKLRELIDEFEKISEETK
jgi:hypothetical protein